MNFDHVTEPTFHNIHNKEVLTFEDCTAAVEAARSALEADYLSEILECTVVNKRSRALEAAEEYLDLHWYEGVRYNIMLFWLV